MTATVRPDVRGSSSPKVTSKERREFLVGALTAAGGATALLAGLPVETEASPQPQRRALAAPPTPHDRDNPMERMLDELDRALAKPLEQRKWTMVIDLQRCIGCKACTVSCAAENNLPPGVIYRPVVEEEVGEFPNVRKRFIPRPCMQCEKPPCVPVCPVGATWQRPDGIVEIDYDACIGCRYCIAACPYNARTADFGEFYGAGALAVEAFVGEDAMAYETRPNFEYGQEWARRPQSYDSPMGNARKCQFCLHRIENGMLPACVTTCLGGATFFGDYNDDQSLVHELVGSGRTMRLREELGTEPKVYYLV